MRPQTLGGPLKREAGAIARSVSSNLAFCSIRRSDQAIETQTGALQALGRGGPVRAKMAPSTQRTDRNRERERPNSSSQLVNPCAAIVDSDGEQAWDTRDRSLRYNDRRDERALREGRHEMDFYRVFEVDARGNHAGVDRTCRRAPARAR